MIQSAQLFGHYLSLLLLWIRYLNFRPKVIATGVIVMVHLNRCRA